MLTIDENILKEILKNEKVHLILFRLFVDIYSTILCL